MLAYQPTCFRRDFSPMTWNQVFLSELKSLDDSMQVLHLIRSNWPFRGAKPDGPSCHGRRRSFWEFLCCPVVVWLEKPVPNSETHQFLSANVVEPKRMTSLCDRPLPIYTPDERLSLFHTGSSCNSMPISSNSCRAGITHFYALPWMS